MKQVAPYKKDQKDHEKHESIWLEDDLKLTSLTNKYITRRLNIQIIAYKSTETCIDIQILKKG